MDNQQQSRLDKAEQQLYKTFFFLRFILSEHNKHGINVIEKVRQAKTLEGEQNFQI